MGAGADAAASAEPLAQIPLGQLADIHTTSGPPLIKNEDGALTGWVYVDVAGRDIGGYVADAKQAVREKIENAGLLPAGLPPRMDRPIRIHAARQGTAQGRRPAHAGADLRAALPELQERARDA